MIPHTFTASDGLKLAYYVDDNTDPWADAPTLLMLHAAMGNAQRFYAWVPMLSRHYRVVRLDLRGHGNSGHAGGGQRLRHGSTGQGHARTDGSSGLQECPRRGQLGRRLYRPEPRHGSCRAGQEPDPVRLDAGPAQQPGRDLDPEDRQGRHPEVPDGHDRGPLRAGHRSAQDRMVRLVRDDVRSRLCRPLRGPDVLARLERSPGRDQVPHPARHPGRRDRGLDQELRCHARAHCRRAAHRLRGPAAQYRRSGARALRRGRPGLPALALRHAVACAAVPDDK